MYEKDTTSSGGSLRAHLKRPCSRCLPHHYDRPACDQPGLRPLPIARVVHQRCRRKSVLLKPSSKPRQVAGTNASCSRVHRVHNYSADAGGRRRGPRTWSSAGYYRRSQAHVRRHPHQSELHFYMQAQDERASGNGTGRSCPSQRDVKKNNQPEGGYARPELVAAAFLVQNLEILGLACKAVSGLREHPSPNIRCVLGKRTPNLLA